MPLILVVDDSSFQRKYLRKTLEKEGYEVVEASEGAKGVSVAEQRKPDVILMDALMPEMSGQEALEELKRRDITTPVIVVTADIQETTKKEFLDLGAVGFVNKPVKGDQLFSLLNIIKCYT